MRLYIELTCIGLQDPFWQVVKPKFKPNDTYEVYFAVALDCVDDFRAKHSDVES